MNKAIVTGANGFIGSELVKEFSKRNIITYAVVRNHDSNIEKIKGIKNVNIIYCSLDKISDLKNLILDREVDIFYHFAWEGVSGKLRTDYERQLFNAKCTCDGVKTANEMGIKRFVFSSSIAVYETSKIMSTNSPPSEISIYGAGKLAGDYMAKALANTIGIDYITGIVSNIYGIGDYSSRLINTTIRQVLHHKPTAFTESYQIYDFMYIEDAARAFYHIGKQGVKNKIYYIGNQTQKPLKNFLLELKNCIDPNIELGFGKVPFLGKSLKYNEFNVNTLYQDTDFSVKYSFKEGIMATITWIMEEEKEDNE